MPEQIIVIAKLKAKLGKEAELLKECQTLVEPSRAEAPCLVYNLHQDPEDSKNLMFYEVWESKKDLDVHLQTPSLKRFLKLAPGLTEGEADVTIWKIV